MPTIEGCRAKLARADEHLALLTEIFAGYSAAEPYKVHYQRNPDEDFFRYWLEERLSPPLKMSVVIGDIAYQLRSCLDHLVWQLALLTTEHPRRTEFPIFESSARYRKESQGKLTGVPQGAVDIIKSLQPFQRQPDPKNHLLWVLHEACIIDKHRFFNPVSAWVQFPKLSGGVRAVGSSPLDPGQIFAEVPVLLEPEQHFNDEIEIHIRLRVGGPMESAGVEVMRHIRDMIRDQVLPAFEQFFPQAPAPSGGTVVPTS